MQRGVDNEQVSKLSDYNNAHDALSQCFEIRQCVDLYFDGDSVAQAVHFTLQGMPLVVANRSFFRQYKSPWPIGGWSLAISLLTVWNSTVSC